MDRARQVLMTYLKKVHGPELNGNERAELEAELICLELNTYIQQQIAKAMDEHICTAHPELCLAQELA